MARQSRTFRVFISSTFGDFKAEREALQATVFPRLRELCAAQGCRFQAIDLRWGVSEEAAIDQQTMAICLEELRRCQRTTPRPNFVILMGQRYGWRPLPPDIPAQEFAEIERHIAAADHPLLVQWYRLDRPDNNAAPPRYCLQPRQGEYADPDRWAAVESRLHAAMAEAAKASGLSESARFKYEAAATHQEIEAGALMSEDAGKHVYAYIRTIDGLPADASEFRDLDAEGRPDLDAQQRLQALKDTLSQLLPNNIRKYSTTWARDGMSGAHLDQLCADMYEDLSQVIGKEAEQLKKIDPVVEEIDAHDAFAADRVRWFTGRADLVQKVVRYLHRKDPSPLMLYGDSGSGKSSLLAQASLQRAHGLSTSVTVTRFIGVTPATTDVRSLLDGMCRQIDREYGHHDATIPGEYSDLIAALQQRLTLATAEKPLLIFIDALDQLSDADRGRNLMWLPMQLPPNVHLIVSTLPSECLDILKQKLPRRNQLEVSPMPEAEGEELLGHWLQEVQRSIQPEQWRVVMQSFSLNGLPLHLKLAFEEVRRWNSWIPVDDKTLPGDVVGIIDALFGRLSLQSNHGETLVSRSLGYLVAARNGLTEDELLDVLSRDPEVIEDFQHRSPKSPIVATLPFIIWSRLYAELEPYLAERSGDGTSLLSFYHRQLQEQAARHFLSGKDRLARHGALADYFAASATGGWSRRALSELAWQQIQSARWKDLADSLTDLNFLEAKCKAGATYDLVADFNNAARAEMPAYIRRRIDPFARFVKANAHVLTRRPELLFQQAANEPDRAVTGRIAQRQLASARGDVPWLNWVNKPQTPSPCLMVLVGHIGDINACSASPDGSRLVSVGRDQAIHVWDAATGMELLTLFGHRTPIATCAFSPDGQHVASGGYDGSLKLWDPWTGVELTPLPGHKNLIELCTFSGDGQRLLSTANDNTLRIWDVYQRKQIVSVPLAETAMGCAFSPDGEQFVSGNQRGELTLWDVRTCRPIEKRKAHDSETMGCFYSPSGRWLFSTSQDKTIKAWNPDLSGEPLVFRGHTDGIWAVCVSEERGLVASASNDQTVRLWDLKTGEELATLRGHTEGVLSCAFLPGDNRLVTSSWDGTIRIWDVSQIKRPRRVRRKVSLDSDDKTVWLTCGFSPDGKMLAAGSEDDLRIWDATTGKLRQTFEGHPDFVRNLQFAPDGDWLVVSSGRRLFRWTIGQEKPLKLRNHRNLISGCSISPDGKQVLTSSEDRTLRIASTTSSRGFKLLFRDKVPLTSCAAARNWDWAAVGTKDGRLQIVKLPSGTTRFAIQAHTDEVTTIAVSADGGYLATGSMDRLVKIWHATTGKEVAVLSGHSASILSCVFSPDGRTLATLSRDTTLKIWDMATFKCGQTLVGHATAFQACGFSPDGSRLLTGSYDGTLRLWNPQNGSELAMLSGFRDSVAACDVSPDGNLIATASHFRALKLHDGETGRELRSLIGHEAEVRDCAFSPVGEPRVVSASADSTLRLWNAATGRCVTILKGHQGPVQSCAFSPDGKRIVSGSWDRTLKLWDAQTGQELATLDAHRDWVQRVTFSPDGSRIASCGLDRTVKLWSAEGKLEASLAGHKDAVNLCSFSADGALLLSGSGDGSLKVWDVAKKKERFHLRGHTGQVRSCEFSPDNSLAVSAGMDRTVRLWDVRNGDGMVLGEHESWVLSCAFSPDGRWLVSGGHDRFVKLWQVAERPLDCEYWVGAAVRNLRWHPSGMKFVVGDEEGGVHLLRRERREERP
jgi:WD40 repeat protein